jgi:hypothetical protein
MKNQFFLFLFLTLVVLSCTRCKEECIDSSNPDCPNFDPCIAWNAQQQEIKIFAGGYEALDHDTIWCLSDINFQLALPADSARWTIGSDPTVHSNTSLSYYFGAPYSFIQVRCISYRTDEFGCSGHLVKMDTLQKTIHLVHWPDLPIWNWEFEGTLTDTPNDVKHISFAIEVDPNSSPALPHGKRYIRGLIEPCEVEGECEGIEVAGFNHRKVQPDSPCCFISFEGQSGHVSLNKQNITLTYRTSGQILKTFKGKRIN